MQFSQDFYDLRASFEGCKLTAYQDGAGIWTIGYGTTYYPDGSRVKQGDTCTAQQAIDYANHGLTNLEAHITATTPTTINQGQFDAIGDFCYNAGQGAWDGSTLRKLINSNPSDFTNIETQFTAWSKCHQDGQLVTVPGLLRRRECEFYLYKNGSNADNFLE
jgi:lysozyme